MDSNCGFAGFVCMCLCMCVCLNVCVFLVFFVSFWFASVFYLCIFNGLLIFLREKEDMELGV